MYGSGQGFSSYTGSYPSNLMNSNFLSNKRTVSAPSNEPEYIVKEREAAVSNAWLLTPAIVGTGAAFIFNFLFRPEKEGNDPKKAKRGAPGAVIYTLIATAGVSYYIYKVLTAADGHSLYAFFPVSSAITISILYYAVIYNRVYILNPKSFTGEIDGNLVNELITFIYFSITTFATAGMGDMAPVTNTAKILVSLQVLFFVFIFTMGIVFFSDP